MTEKGPMRICAFCGLFATQEAAMAHAAKHGIEVIMVMDGIEVMT